MRTSVAALWLVVGLSSLGACGKKDMPVATIDVGGKSVKVEIAANPEHRSRGLMFRESMADDRGMLFMYGEQKPLSFWMKDTLIPLDIAYADKSGEIKKIAQMQPLDTKPTKSLYPVMYALEMNQGWFEKNGVGTGAKITGIPNDIKAK